MIGPPFLKLSTKKFLSIAVSGMAAGGLALVAGAALAVVVTGDAAAVSGVTPGAGDMATAGLVMVAGAVAAAAGLAGAVTGGGGGGWPKELKARVTEQRLTISSVFIGLIGKFFPARIFNKDFPFVLSSMRQVRVQQNFRVCLFGISDSGVATKLISHHPTFWAVA
jgi:hypothetical protein